MRMLPTSFFLLFLLPMISKMPTKAKASEKFSGFSRRIQKLSDSTPIRVRIHAVIVVPILEPMITAMLLPMDIMPELTRPTSITVTAEEDWIAAVTPIPKISPINRLEVSFLRPPSSLPPAIRSRPPESIFIPYRKKAKPPKSVMIEKKSIFISFLFIDILFYTILVYQKPIKCKLEIFTKCNLHHRDVFVTIIRERE